MMHRDLAAILAEGEALLEAFEDSRDRLRALPPDVVPELLKAADDPGRGAVRGVLWYALTDWQYPPALARLVDLLDDELDDVVIAGAFALDGVAGKRFDVEKRFLDRGWPDYDGMRTVLAPEIRAWWASGGKDTLESVAAWRARVSAKPAPSPTSFDPNLAAWVLEHGVALTGRKGVVMDRTEVLPAHQGTHLVPGLVRDAGGQVLRAVLMVDSDAGRVVVALVPTPEPPGWRPVPADEVVPDFATEGVNA